MAARDKDERVEISTLGAHAKWGRTVDRTAATSKAREAFLRSLEPGPEVTDPAQRQSMFEHNLREHMIRLRRAARKTRQAKAGPSAPGTAA